MTWQSQSSTPNIIRLIKSRRLRWTGHVAGIKESRNTFKISTGKSTGNINLARTGHGREEYVRMNFKEIDVNTMNWLI